MQIRITAGSITMDAELNASTTAQLIGESLPIEGSAQLWGDEIYFEIPVVTGQEPAARADVEVGELGYWPVGHAFCIFFGPTPASAGDQPRAYSPVNVVGRVSGDATDFKEVAAGTRVRLERSE
jgi:hypothetical protein